MSNATKSAQDKRDDVPTSPAAGSIAAVFRVPPGKFDRQLHWLRELIAPLAWIYILFKLFVVDIDQLVFRAVAPANAWWLDFKLLGFLVVSSLFWVFLGGKKLSWQLAFIAFYPAIIVLWRIPALVARQRNWNLALGLLNAIVAFYRTAKYSFAVGTLYAVAFFTLLTVENRTALWIASTQLLILVLVSYLRQFFLIFRQSDVYQVHVRAFRGTRKFFRSMFVIDDTIKEAPRDSLSASQVATWTSNLQHSVLFNRLCLYWARRLRDYQRSGFISVSHAFVVLILIVSSVVSFSFINLGVYRADPSQFAVTGNPNLFTFFWYSFNNLIFNSITDLQPGGVIARSIYMAQTGCILLIGLLFISLLLSHRSQRHTEELDAAIRGLEAEGRDMEGLICSEYRLTSMAEALEALRTSKAAFAEFIFKMSAGL